MDSIKKRLPPTFKDFFRPSYHAAVKGLRGLVRAFFAAFARLLGRRRFLSLIHFLSDEVDTSLDVEGIRFEAGSYLPYYRAATLMTKEPDTIAWIDDIVKENEVFYDVGANIGVFSLYVATRKNALAIAFEPQATTYGILNQNIYLNGLANRIKALNIAMYNKTTFSNLNVSEVRPGKAGNSFGTVASGGDERPAFLQGMIGMRMDDFIRTFDPPFPNHVKIDVDANEPEIVEGMEGILADRRLRSIAVELDIDNDKTMSLLKRFGFEALEGDRYVNHVMLSLRPRINFFFVRR